MKLVWVFGALIAIASPIAAQSPGKGANSSAPVRSASTGTPSAPSTPAPAYNREIEWMTVVTKKLASSLVDPGSAIINLPFGFTPQPTTWKVWGVNMSGYFTCGSVNSRNRMGGYVGETVFLAHISPQGEVTTTTDSSKYPVLGNVCAAGRLPPINPATTAAIFRKAPKDASGSISQELAEIAELHRNGTLTDSEFAAAKARILGSK